MKRVRYYLLAVGAEASRPGWSYEVSVCFDDVPQPIGFSEGSGQAAAGGIFTAEAALQPRWRKHFEIAGGQWLLPYIVELASGQSLPKEEVLSLAAESLGRTPPSTELPLD
ncbi:MAG: hypothetical protein JST05_07920 [Acidobacteria bacterium]|nr:hypothetical protein [Acidobacteriota bacterium]